MTDSTAASQGVLGWTQGAELPESSPKRPTGITGRTSALTVTSLSEVCSFQLPKGVQFSIAIDSRRLRDGETVRATVAGDAFACRGDAYALRDWA